MGFKVINHAEYSCDNPACNQVIIFKDNRESLPSSWICILGLTVIRSGTPDPIRHTKSTLYFCCAECYNKYVMIE